MCMCESVHVKESMHGVVCGGVNCVHGGVDTCVCGCGCLYARAFVIAAGGLDFIVCLSCSTTY